jgi:membrane associated rhomboid family serine protease
VSGWLDQGAGGVAYGAHIGGFVAGAGLAMPFMIGRSRGNTRESQPDDRYGGVRW